MLSISLEYQIFFKLKIKQTVKKKKNSGKLSDFPNQINYKMLKMKYIGEKKEGGWGM